VSGDVRGREGAHTVYQQRQVPLLMEEESPFKLMAQYKVCQPIMEEQNTEEPTLKNRTLKNKKIFRRKTDFSNATNVTSNRTEGIT
jgi:hypothetical protein